MSISAMKQALEALEFAGDLIAPITENCQCQICLAHTALKQAIEQEEKIVPSDYLDGHQPDVDIYDVWVEQKPVHAIDMNQEPVDETAKREREWVGLTEKEIADLACSVDSYKGLCQATEAKLKEKNG